MGSVLKKLFQSSERPPAPPGLAPVPLRESGPPSSGTAAKDDLILSGVIIAQNTQMALLQPPGAASPELVKIGDTVGPYRLTAVQEDRVKLSGPDGEIVLRLSTGTPSNKAPGGVTGAAGPAAASRDNARVSPAAAAHSTGSTAKRRPERRQVRAAENPATLEGQAPVARDQDREARRAEKRSPERRAQGDDAKARTPSRQTP
jgi:hypothetical protein